LSDRKGYFEEANNGTIFLDEIGELPLSTQVRLLRVLEAGEFMKVGSSRVLKTNVRVVAATNVVMEKAIHEGKFREDLYYRLSSIPITIPPLRDRSEDIYLLFRKFANDFALRYRMPGIRLDDEAKELLMRYRWPGNIRQLKNITEQISVIEKSRDIGADILRNYIPFHVGDHLPAVINQNKKAESDFSNEREILYKVLFDMKRDMNDLKKIVMDLMQHGENIPFETEEHARIIKNLYNDLDPSYEPIPRPTTPVTFSPVIKEQPIQDTEEFVEESLSLESKEIELIRKALERHAGKRKHAAQELGISERTLYRKIKEYNIE
jgi:transcriptional regulator with PAS, ATPase and Fis domain